MTDEKKGRRLQARLAKQDEDAYYNGLALVMDKPVGRRMVWLWLVSLGYESSAFTVDPQQTAYHLGRKDAASELVAQIKKHHHDKFLTMLKEANDVHTERTIAVAAILEQT